MKGDITLAYYDTDLPQAITKGETITNYSLILEGDRPTAITTSTRSRRHTNPGRRGRCNLKQRRNGHHSSGAS